MMDLKTANKSYRRKKSNTKLRVDRNGNPIEFRLTFEEWCQIWIDSGHWGEWGNKKGQYNLSRYDDIGHYEIGNVFVQLHSDNTREMNKRRTGVLNPNYGTRICEGYTNTEEAKRKQQQTRLERYGPKMGYNTRVFP